MRDLFRGFERREVEFLLIGGQAAILYGAAHFTQDIDLWLRPAGANVRAFLETLAALGARVHKLTPPLDAPLIRRGHGFHFVIPRSAEPDVYLDVMGRPPRVGSFAKAARRAERFETPWGALPVVAIDDLVELKKTDRPSDYEVISRLVCRRLERARRIDARLLRWAVRNAFRADDLAEIVARWGERLPRAAAKAVPALALLLRRRARGEPPGEEDLASAARTLALRALDLQEEGRRYWRPHRAELREMRSRGELLPEGRPVRSLLRDLRG